MTSSLQARLALALLIGVLLIPLATSSLRGLTHLVSCATPVAAGFEVAVPEPREEPSAVLLDPTSVTRGPDGAAGPGGPATSAPVVTVPRARRARQHEVCGGLVVDMRLSRPSPGIMRIDLPVTNRGGATWHGTAELDVGGRTFPVELGRVPPGRTVTRSVEVTVDDRVDRVRGQLLLGP